jgi:hypothetical protein
MAESHALLKAVNMQKDILTPETGELPENRSRHESQRYV